jgi:hypothetical protein
LAARDAIGSVVAGTKVFAGGILSTNMEEAVLNLDAEAFGVLAVE